MFLSQSSLAGMLFQFTRSFEELMSGQFCLHGTRQTFRLCRFLCEYDQLRPKRAGRICKYDWGFCFWKRVVWCCFLSFEQHSLPIIKQEILRRKSTWVVSSFLWHAVHWSASGLHQRARRQILPRFVSHMTQLGRSRCLPSLTSSIFWRPSKLKIGLWYKLYERQEYIRTMATRWNGKWGSTI